MELLIKKRPNGLFNLASGMAFPLKDVIEFLREKINPHSKIQYGTIEYRQDQVMHLEGDISKLSKALGWTPKYSVFDGLEMDLKEKLNEV